jgi:ABC-type multidrug transport system ATPase subunit
VSVEAAAPPALRIVAEGLGHRYAGRRGLEPVSFALSAPGAVSVCGANGSGKSTLLRIVAGLLRPSHGRLRVELDGKDLPPEVRRHRVGLASPELQLYDELTAFENLRFAGEARGIASPRDAAMRALERVGLEARAGDRVPSLSSGMKQRLRLGFAVLGDPPILMLDEPGSHLDDPGREAVRALVADARRRGLVLVATNEESERRLGDERIELRGSGLGRPA